MITADLFLHTWPLLGALASGLLLLAGWRLHLRETRRQAEAADRETLVRLQRRCEELERALAESGVERESLLRRTTLLVGLWRDLTSADTPERAASVLLGAVLRGLRARRGALYVRDGSHLVLKAAQPEDPGLPAAYRMGDGWLGWAASQPFPVLRPDLDRLDRALRGHLAATDPVPAPWDAYLPLRVGAEGAGVLAVDGIRWEGGGGRSLLSDLTLPASLAVALLRARQASAEAAARDGATGLLHRRAFAAALEAGHPGRALAGVRIPPGRTDAETAAAVERAARGLQALLGPEELAGRIGPTTLAALLKDAPNEAAKRLEPLRRLPLGLGAPLQQALLPVPARRHRHAELLQLLEGAFTAPPPDAVAAGTRGSGAGERT